jgi:hypothetical protein
MVRIPGGSQEARHLPVPSNHAEKHRHRSDQDSQRSEGVGRRRRRRREPREVLEGSNRGAGVNNRSQGEDDRANRHPWDSASAGIHTSGGDQSEDQQNDRERSKRRHHIPEPVDRLHELAWNLDATSEGVPGFEKSGDRKGDAAHQHGYGRKDQHCTTPGGPASIKENARRESEHAQVDENDTDRRGPALDHHELAGREKPGGQGGDRESFDGDQSRHGPCDERDERDERDDRRPRKYSMDAEGRRECDRRGGAAFRAGRYLHDLTA